MKDIDFEKIILKAGSHSTGSAGMCVMEAVTDFAGEPPTDGPKCVFSTIAVFLRIWNDALLANADRNRLLRPFIPKIIGTASTDLIALERSRRRA